MNFFQNAAAPLGRVLLSGIFLLSGFGKIGNWDPTVQVLANKGLEPATVFLGAAVALELLGGVSLLVGWYARIGAFLLIVFLVPVSAIMHDFWNFQGEAQQGQMIHFLKNMTIVGGLLMVIAHGAGPLSIDNGLQPTDKKT